MLRELKIENLAIIDELDLEFKDGFIVLTGETGAGKSIILNAINLLIGEKTSVDMIRDGADQLFAEGVFFIEEKQKKILEKFEINSEDNEVIVRRYLSRVGKGKAFVNNVRVSLVDLKEIMGSLVDIVGQHSHQMLLQKNNHIILLDSFLREDGKEIKNRVEHLAKEYKLISQKLENIDKEVSEIKEKKEFYEYQLSEIDALDLKSGEDEKLEEEYKILFNAGKIKEKLETSLYRLTNGDINALNSIHFAKKNLESLTTFGSEYEDAYEKLDSIYYELEDCVDIVNTINDSLDVDDFALEKASNRLDKINKIKTKYNKSIDEIIEFRNEIFEKLSLMDESGFEVKNLIAKKEKIESDYFIEANKLRELRLNEAKNIEEKLESELKFLKMEGAKFSVNVEKTDKIKQDGIDDVEFLISTNVGQGMKPLAKIASGGEVSRIMLAIKVIFSKVDNIPILIFDEIDTGVGGETVRKIGEKLKEIGKNAQIISITHSPAIAVKANQQFFIKKSSSDSITKTTVTELSKEDRVHEIARMLAGENITESVLELSKEMLNEA